VLSVERSSLLPPSLPAYGVPMLPVCEQIVREVVHDPAFKHNPLLLPLLVSPAVPVPLPLPIPVPLPTSVTLLLKTCILVRAKTCFVQGRNCKCFSVSQYRLETGIRVQIESIYSSGTVTRFLGGS